MEALDKNLFNIDLILPTVENTRLFGEVKTAAIFETGSKIFHQDGLFSTNIFGPLGSSVRNEKEAIIDLKLPTMHPLVFEIMCSLNSKLLKIAESSIYVKFNSKEGDFDIVAKEEGQTGYSFLIEHLDKLKFKETDSTERKYKIEFCKKYCNSKSLITRWVVLPAGLRDYTEGDKGNPEEDEINSIYRTLLSSTNMLRVSNTSSLSLKMLDPIRFKIQKTLVEIYYYIKTLLDGKSKFIQGKFTKRATMHGTRNIITPSPAKISDLTDEKRIKSNHTTVGLYQYVKAIAPITMNLLLSKFISKIFNPNSTSAYLVNKDSLKIELVEVPVTTRDKWLSMDGLNSIMNKLAQPEIRSEPIKIDNHYLMLVHDQGTKVEIIQEPGVLQDREDIKKENLRPITYGELFYLTVEDVVSKYPAFNTRYPVVGLGGIYPSWVYLKTTTTGRKVEVTYNNITKILYEYPKRNENWVESMSVDGRHIGRLGADYDGDSCIGKVYARFNIKMLQKFVDFKLSKGSCNMAIRDSKVMYKYGLLDLEDFPRGELIKTKGNIDFYKVPNGIQVLTIWNNKLKWVKPKMFSVHRNLKMLSVKTHKGNTIECSDEHSIVTIDENLNYKRTNPAKGMTIPRIRMSIDDFSPTKKYTINSDNIRFSLNRELGYVIGAIIGDGWVDHDKFGHNLTTIHLASITNEIPEQITKLLQKYGYKNKVYSISNIHTFNGYNCKSKKHTWRFKPLSNLLRNTIGYKAINKQLPYWWVETSSNFRWGLLAGLIDTDGTVYINNKNKKITVSYTTISRKLAYDFIALCNSLNITAGLTTHKRKNKSTLEYYIILTNEGILKCKKYLKLFHPVKSSRLSNLTLNQDVEISKYTPNASEEKLRELLSWFSFSNESTYYYRIQEAIKRAKKFSNGGFFNRKHFLEMVKYKPEAFMGGYWKKYKEIVENVTIEWELITSVKEIPEITEAYDLTTPPFSTFVMQNGIIVYDSLSFVVVYSEESIREIKNFLNDKKAYISADNKIIYSSADDVAELVMSTLTE